MLNYIIRRLAYGALTVLGVLGLLFILFFTLTKPDDIARQLERLLHDSALRQQLVARGRQRALQFSWDDAASGVLQQCYEAVAA